MRKILVCSAIALLAAGCKDGGTSTPVASSVTVAPGSVSLDAVGATQVVRATVLDQKGRPMRGAPLSWSSNSTAVSVTGLGGDSAVVTAVANGSAQLTATSGSASGTATAQVAQAASSAQKAGDGQTGPVGTALPQPVRVLVRDRLNAPVSGVAVTFAVEGGGSLSATSGVSGPDGAVSATWTLGTTAGSGTQRVVASVAGVGQVVFTAIAVAGPPAAASVAGGNNQAAARGSAVAVAPRVQVTDAFGNTVAGAAVQFSVTSGGGSVAGGAQTTDFTGLAVVGGWTLGPSAGTNTLTATFPGTSVPPVVFTATALNPGSISVAAGHNQAAMVGTALPTAPSVVVRDAGGAPVAGATVTFAVTSGGGSVASASATTDANGVASPGSWVLGAVSGPNTLSASVADLASAPAVIRAVGCSGGGGTGYQLTLCFTTEVSPSQRAVFQSAASRWAAVITGDVPDLAGTIPAGSCGTGSPSISMTFDDLVIFASIEAIDGPGQVLGQAGWCFRRTGGLPIVGLMRFDAADVATLEGNGQFSAVILHEMGHVLGIGTLWNAFGLLQNPSSSGSPIDTYFSGANGIAGFDAIGGSTYTGGQKVPVENTGGGGTVNSHWRESVLANELMTGFLNSSLPNPLSLLTVRSLADLGYVVDPSAADPFFLTLSLRQGDVLSSGLKLHNDVYTGPRHTIDRQGRVARVRD